MGSVVCQGLQSCLEPRLTETLVLRHKMSPQATPLPLKPKLEVEDNNGGHKTIRWNFLKALENPSSNTNNLAKTEEIYVHPMVKRSKSALTTKSLEMCTESLGSETGSEVSESGDEFSSLSPERVRSVPEARLFGRKMMNHRRGGGFPPPLTSISGSDATVKVKHHREGGRLVINAVSVSNCGTNFQAERTNGRLRLLLLKDCSVNCESERAEKEQVWNEEGGEVEIEDGYFNTDYDDDDEDDDDDEIGLGESKRRTELTQFEDLSDFEKKRLTRCNEGGRGNKGLANWSAFWVAIS